MDRLAFRAKRPFAAAVLAALVSAAASAAVTVDVLFAYDRSAASWLAESGEDGRDLASRTIEAMNSVLPATGLDAHFSFHLAGVAFSGAEAVGGSAEERLSGSVQSVADSRHGRATGMWQDVQDARDAHGADIVVLLVDAGDGGGRAGMSWCLDGTWRSDPSKFAPWAYSACNVRSASGYVVTHEVGHVMGAGHSDLLAEDPGPQLHPYSSAFHFTDSDGNRFHTIMGYGHTTPEDSGYSPYPAFSSPEFAAPDGTPLGDALHDNTRTLRETCVAVSKFRKARGGGDSAKFAAKTVAACKVSAEDGSLAGVAVITVAKTDKKGKSKVSAEFYGTDGKKKSAKTAADVGLEGTLAAVRDVRLQFKGETAPLVATVLADGSVSGSMGGMAVEKASGVAAVPGAPRFRVAGLPAALGGMKVLNDVEAGGVVYHLAPDGDGAAFSVSGRKWVFAKAAAVKYAKGADGTPALVVDTGKDGSKTNLCGLKLSVNGKTGVFKGAFTVYTDAGTAAKPKVGKAKFKVSGIAVDGAGAGQAVCKKLSSGPLKVEIR